MVGDGIHITDQIMAGVGIITMEIIGTTMVTITTIMPLTMVEEMAHTETSLTTIILTMEEEAIPITEREILITIILEMALESKILVRETTTTMRQEIL